MAKGGTQGPTDGDGGEGGITKVWVEAAITEHLVTLEEKIDRFAAATAFQGLMEAVADNMGAIASPLSNLGPQRAQPDARQKARLERIAHELARPPEQKPYLNDPHSSYGRAR